MLQAFVDKVHHKVERCKRNEMACTDDVKCRSRKDNALRKYDF